MKLHTVVLLVMLAACGKANDLPAMRAEAEGLVKNYATRFEDLNTRANSIIQRGTAIGVTNPEAQSVSRMFAGAKSKLDETRGAINAAGGDIAKVKDRLEMQRLIDNYTARLGKTFTEINADFDAVESWLALAEAAHSQVSRTEPPSVQLPPPTSPVQ